MTDWGTVLVAVRSSRTGGGVETELVLTALRACWLWNAAGIDLSQLQTESS
jgi:hypothetical protein